MQRGKAWEWSYNYRFAHARVDQNLKRKVVDLGVRSLVDCKPKLRLILPRVVRSCQREVSKSKREEWCDRSKWKPGGLQSKLIIGIGLFHLVSVHPPVDGQQISSTTPSVATRSKQATKPLDTILLAFFLTFSYPQLLFTCCTMIAKRKLAT